MSKTTKLIKGGLGLLGIGYIAGILTAPRSGRRTRSQLEQKVSTANIDKDLKAVYKQTKRALRSFARHNPKLSGKLKDVEEAALNSQAKVESLLKAAHGQGKVDDDLEEALKNAKNCLENLKNYLTK